MTDSRFELESDIISFLKTHDGPIPPYTLWLDRQEAITSTGCDECSADWEADRDEWKAKANLYRDRVASYECDLRRNEGECDCSSEARKKCIKDGWCAAVLKAVDGE